jgi:hypothetical protein
MQKSHDQVEATKIGELLLILGACGDCGFVFCHVALPLMTMILGGGYAS